MNKNDMFYAIVGFIFAELYEDISGKRTIYFDEFHCSFPELENEDCSPWVIVMADSFNWLREEGYICFESQTEYYVFNRVGLTAKSLHPLAVRAISTHPKTIGDRLVETVEAGNLEKVKQYGAAAMFISFNAAV